MSTLSSMTTANDIIDAAVTQLKAAQELVDKLTEALDPTTREVINRRIEIADSYINLLQHMPYMPPQSLNLNQ